MAARARLLNEDFDFGVVFGDSDGEMSFHSSDQDDINLSDDSDVDLHGLENGEECPKKETKRSTSRLNSALAPEEDYLENLWDQGNWTAEWKWHSSVSWASQDEFFASRKPQRNCLLLSFCRRWLLRFYGSRDFVGVLGL